MADGMHNLIYEARIYYSSHSSDSQDREIKRNALAKAFVSVFIQGDTEKKVKAVSLLLEAIEGKIKKESKD